jgi:hypothetical protein
VHLSLSGEECSRRVFGCNIPVCASVMGRVSVSVIVSVIVKGLRLGLRLGSLLGVRVRVLFLVENVRCAKNEGGGGQMH